MIRPATDARYERRRRGITTELTVDTGVVDHGVHRAERIHLLCDAADFCRATQIANHYRDGTWAEVSERRRPLGRTRVQDHLVARVQERMSRRAAEALGTTSDEDTGI